MSDNTYRSSPPEELAVSFMDPNRPKTELEHWAVREIERLREALVLGAEVLASHKGSPQREWHGTGAWLYPGDSINVVRAPLPEIKVVP